MIYLYTTDNCCNCESLKQEYKTKNIQYVERSADRIKSPVDEIDREALINASMNNMELPVIVDWKE